MSYELAGTVKLIQDVETFKNGSFRKRGIVVTVEDGKFPQDILLEFVQDKISLLDDVNIGDNVQITFDLRGREYNGRYYNNLQGWKLEKAGDAGTVENKPMEKPVPDEAEDIDEVTFDDIEDPF